MRIAQVAPLNDSIPPRFGGETEQSVFYLTEELAALGHQVTLFASGDSVTRATLEKVCRAAIRLSPGCLDPVAPHMLMMERVARCAHAFDIIHFHTEWLHLPLFSRLDVPFITTLHGRLESLEARTALRAFSATPLVSVSDAQRAPAPDANWLATVPRGLPPAAFPVGPGSSNGPLTFLGRISPNSGAEAAIELALATGRRIRIAADTGAVDRAFFEHEVRPFLDCPSVDFVGEIGKERRAAFLGEAAALLWPAISGEPFGRVTVEAAACGTPVVALGTGPDNEVIEHGVSGYVVRDLAEAIGAVRGLGRLTRAGVRGVFERRFTSRRMAEAYLDVYDNVRIAASASASNHHAERTRHDASRLPA